MGETMINSLKDHKLSTTDAKYNESFRTAFLLSLQPSLDSCKQSIFLFRERSSLYQQSEVRKELRQLELKLPSQLETFKATAKAALDKVKASKLDAKEHKKERLAAYEAMHTLMVKDVEEISKGWQRQFEGHIEGKLQEKPVMMSSLISKPTEIPKLETAKT